MLKILSLSATVFSLSFCLLLYTILGSLQNKISNQLGADILLVPKSSEIEDQIFLFTNRPIHKYFDIDSALEEIDSNDIISYSEQLYTETISNGCCDINTNARVIGFNSSSDFILSPWCSGSTQIDDDEVIIGNGIDALEGQIITIRDRKFKVKSVLSQVGSGIDDALFININVAKSIKKIDSTRNVASAMYVKLKAGINPNDWVRNINNSNHIIRAFSSSSALKVIEKSLINLINLVLVIVLVFSSLILCMKYLLIISDKKIKCNEQKFFSHNRIFR